MKADDQIRLKSGSFDRAAWADLWDRLPERSRRSAAEFVLQQLHAFESNGNWSFSWTYDTNIEREESGAPIFEYTQPGDVMTFSGSLKIGNAGDGEMPTNPELLAPVACLGYIEWIELRQAIPDAKDLGDDFKEFAKQEGQKYVDLVRAGKNPCRVLVPPAEFLAWCTTHHRTPDAASRDAFAAEKFLAVQTLYSQRQRDG